MADVTYNRQTGVQKVMYSPITGASGASISTAEFADGRSTIFYTVSGTRIVSKSTVTVAPGMVPGAGWYIESYNVRFWDPFSKRYRYLRRILNSQRYGTYLDPADPDFVIKNLGPGAGIDGGERSELIGKIYDFETYNIDLWDPYRDGVGAFIAKPSIFNGTHTTRERWHLISYNAGENAQTTLLTGISPTESHISVSTMAGFPVPESPDFPFKIMVDDNLPRRLCRSSERRDSNGLSCERRTGPPASSMRLVRSSIASAQRKRKA